MSVTASGVFVSAMILVLLLEGYLPADIGSLPVVGEYNCVYTKGQKRYRIFLTISDFLTSNISDTDNIVGIFPLCC